MSRKRETYGSISRAIRELLEKQEQEKKRMADVMARIPMRTCAVLCKWSRLTWEIIFPVWKPIRKQSGKLLPTSPPSLLLPPQGRMVTMSSNSTTVTTVGTVEAELPC